MNLAQRQRKTPTPRPKLDQLLNDTSHAVSHRGNRIFCSTCLSISASTDLACKHWLSIQCVPVDASANSSATHIHTPKPINEQLHLGNQISHPSHKLHSYRGVIYCNSCGTRAGRNQIRRLAKQCEPPSEAGKGFLQKISGGLFPPGYEQWPD